MVKGIFISERPTMARKETNVNEEALIEFLKNHLVLTATKKYGSYEIELGIQMIEYGPKQYISSVTIDLPRENP
jgi:hypothetical protein